MKLSFSRKKIEELLLSLTRKTKTLINHTYTKPQTTLENKKQNSSKTFFADTQSNVEGFCSKDLFLKNKKNNKFTVYMWKDVNKNN